MNAIDSTLGRVRRLSRQAQRAGALASSWPDLEKLAMPQPPTPLRFPRAGVLADLCSEAREIQRFLAGLPLAETDLFLSYFVREESAPRLARRLGRPVRRVYQELNDVAEAFLRVVDGHPGEAIRDRRTGRFASRPRSRRI